MDIVKVSSRDLAKQNWSKIVSVFLDTQRSDNTRKAYEGVLGSLADEFGCDLSEVTPAMLAEWSRMVRNRVERGEISPNTGKLRVMAAKSFFRFIGMSKDVLSRFLIAPADLVLRPFVVLSQDEQDRLLATATPGQERAMIATLLLAGLRVSELCKLRTSDVFADEHDRYWLQVFGKGRKKRRVPVSPRLLELLAGVKCDDGGSLFRSRQDDGFYARSRVFQIVKDVVRRAGIDKHVSPHSLRHTCAMNWLENDVPLVAIQKLLGHSSLAVTEKYLSHLEDCKLHEYVCRENG